MLTKWVLVDESQGAACSNGDTVTAAGLAHIAEVVSAQLNGEFAAEYGNAVQVRVASGPADVQPGECVYKFLGTLPDAPGASAYHDDESGCPVSYCAVTTCDSMLGPNGVGVDVSHELCEAQGDPGCNRLLDDLNGSAHAGELCDAVEAQQYPKTCSDSTIVWVSNFLLTAWGIPGAKGPYDYMTLAGVSGAVAPPGPMQTAPAGGANYQLIVPLDDSQEGQVMGRKLHGGAKIVGHRRKGEPHWSSRAGRRMGIKPPAHAALTLAPEPEKTA